MTKRIVLLLALLLNVGIVSSQTKTPFPVSDLTITWGLVENMHEGKPQNLNKLTFTNEGKQTLPASGWKIYFNFGRGIAPEKVQGDVTIKRVNGELFEMTPTSSFKPLAPKQSFAVNYVGGGWLINYTDAPLGFYMLNEKTGKYTNMKRVNIIESTEEKQLMRTDKDKIGIITPEVIYNQNKNIPDLDPASLCPILPTPTEFQRGIGSFMINHKTAIVDLANANNESSYLVTKLNQLLKHNVSVTNQPASHAISFVKAFIGSPEAYELNITSDGIEIKASTGEGFFYGVQSLLQLMPNTVFEGKQNSIEVPAVKVCDSARFDYRAFHLDISRNFQTKDELKKIFDLMALYKMNVFHLHFSDDDGWRIEMPSLPELTQVGSRRGAGSELQMLLPTYGSGADVNNKAGSGYYSEAEFIELLKYAAERHIMVIPEVETPGHARAAIKSMEARYHKYMKEGDKTEAERYRLVHPEDKSDYFSVQSWNDNVMDVSMPSVYNFIERVVDDIVGMYKKAGVRLSTIHMGGDEVPVGVWMKSPAFAELQKQHPNLQDADDLWYYYFGKVNKIFKDRNLFVSGWEEAGVRFTKKNGVRTMIPNPDFANQHFQVDVWNNVLGWGAEDLAYRMANAGYKVVLSCVSNNYLDMSYYKAFGEPGYYWGSYVDIDRPYAFIPFDYYKNSNVDLNGNPIPASVFDCKERLTDYGKSNIVGIKGLLWSETLNSPEAMEYMLLPKVISIAERAWSKDPEWAIEQDRAKSEQLYMKDLHTYFNVVGKYHLNRLNSYAGGFNYRIPSPGILVSNGKADANMQLPGFTLRYTTDGSEPTMKSKELKQSIPFVKGTLKVKAFAKDGRSSRSATVTL